VAESWWGLPFRRPPIYVASLADVTCYGGRLMLREPPTHSTGHLLVVDGRYLVPDSYVQRDGMRTLPAELVELEFTGTPPTVRRNGTHLLLGGAHGQFAPSRPRDQVRIGQAGKGLQVGRTAHDECAAELFLERLDPKSRRGVDDMDVGSVLGCPFEQGPCRCALGRTDLHTDGWAQRAEQQLDDAVRKRLHRVATLPPYRRPIIDRSGPHRPRARS